MIFQVGDIMGTHRSSIYRGDCRRMLLRGWWLASVLLAVTPAADAQRYHIHTYTETDGLPNSQVLALTQESSGLMWFATRSSIATYDGQEWITRGHMSSRLPAQSLLRWDSRSRLWALSRELPIQLQLFDGTRPAGKRWLRIPTPEPAPQGSIATALAVSHSESGPLVAIGTDTGALVLWNGKRWRGLSTSTGDSITALTVLDSRVFVATHNGISVLHGTGDHLSLTRVPSTEGREVLGEKKGSLTGISSCMGPPGPRL